MIERLAAIRLLVLKKRLLSSDHSMKNVVTGLDMLKSYFAHMLLDFKARDKSGL